MSKSNPKQSLVNLVAVLNAAQEHVPPATRNILANAANQHVRELESFINVVVAQPDAPAAEGPTDG